MNSYVGSALRRRSEIQRLVHEQRVRSQQELRALLRARGVAATQPTLSRDIRELGLVKGPNGYFAPAEAAPPAPLPAAGPPRAASVSARRGEKLARLVGGFVLSVERAGTLVIVRTPPADAQPVARAVDEAAPDEVAGTIAGDDTIFLATKSPTDADRLTERLRQLISERPSAHPARFHRHARPARPARKRA